MRTERLIRRSSSGLCLATQLNVNLTCYLNILPLFSFPQIIGSVNLTDKAVLGEQIIIQVNVSNHDSTEKTVSEPLCQKT